MSFQFSPETIVQEFDIAIADQQVIINDQNERFIKLENLIDSKVGLKSKVVTTRQCNCISGRCRGGGVGCGRVECSTCTSIIPNNQAQIDQINSEIKGLQSASGPSQMVSAATSEIERLREAAKPFGIEADVRSDQRAQDQAVTNAQVMADRAITVAKNLQDKKFKEHLVFGGVMLAIIIVTAKILRIKR